MARKRRKQEKNNFQDLAEEREFNKGARSGRVRPINGKADMPNDPAWYKPNQSLVNNVANIPFGIATGYPLDNSRMAPSPTGVEISNPYKTVPGILALPIVPTYGTANDLTDPINTAGNAIITAMNQAQTSTQTAEAPDIMNYICALDNAYMWYSHMCRVYGLVSNFEALDRYTPEALLRSMNVDYADIKANLANFRYYINQFAYDLGQFVVPKGFSIIERHAFLFSGVYTDADNAKAQYYVFYPQGLWTYSEVAVEPGALYTGSRLDYQPICTNAAIGQSYLAATTTGTYGFDGFVTVGDALIRPLKSSEDVRKIAAMMLKTFGVNGLYSVSPIAETYKVKPTYSKEVLMEIENAYVFTESPFKGSLVQNAGINAGWLQATYQLVSPFDGTMLTAATETLNVLQSLEDSKVTLNLHSGEDNPSSDTVMTMTRFSNGGYYAFTPGVNGGEFYYTPRHVASELIVGAWIYYFNPAGSNGSVLPGSSLARNKFATIIAYDNSTTLNTVKFRQTFDLVAIASKFDWCFKYKIVGYTHPSSGPKISILKSQDFFDLDNFTTISLTDLDDMNHVAMLGLLVCTSPNSLKLN